MSRVDPTWKTALYAGSSVTGFVVEVCAGGELGVGGTAAHVAQISPDDLQAQIEGPVRSALLGADAFAGNSIRRRLVPLLRNGTLHARSVLAADTALNDLVGKLTGLACHALWGGATRTEIVVVRMVGIKPPDELERAVRKMIEEGYTHFKIKIGTGIADDADRIRRIREAFGDTIWIGVDGNDAYTVEEAIALTRALEPFGVGLIEQPIPAEDLDGLARVTAASDIPIMADQYVESVPTALDVCRKNAADVVSLKLVKTGLIDEARRIAEVCEAYGVGVHMGGSVAPAAVDAAQVHLAASLPWIAQECEVGEFLAVAGDPTRGLEVIDGRIRVDQRPGLGLAVAAA